MEPDFDDVRVKMTERGEHQARVWMEEYLLSIPLHEANTLPIVSCGPSQEILWKILLTRGAMELERITQAEYRTRMRQIYEDWARQ